MLSDDGRAVRQPSVRGCTARALTAELVRTLLAAHIADAHAEARDLLAAVLDRPRFWPVLNPEELVDPADVARARAAASRRAAGAPFAYAVGRAAFRHLTLDVDDRVLIPRQETEMLVDVALAQIHGRNGTAIDVGTGSGAIALALATESSLTRIIATDVSTGALAVARANAARLAPHLRAVVEFRVGSLLAPVADERVCLVIANPPYIAYDEALALPANVRNWEPAVALFSGHGGMAATEAIIRGAARLLEPGGLLAVEVDARRAAIAADIALSDERYRDVSVQLDLAGRERILLATRKDG